MTYIQQQKFSQLFPQNKIIKNPLYGTLLIIIFSIIFSIIYHPLGSQACQYFGYEITMIIYSIVSGSFLYLWINLLKKIKYFSKESTWTLNKELLSIFILLFFIGLTIYFLAFILEEPAERWNFATFFDSLKNAFLIGIIPFSFFTIINLGKKNSLSMTDIDREKIKITSQLKNESLYVNPQKLIYAVSDSNYVCFYIQTDTKIQKKTIRNTLTNIENQFSSFPYIIRVHRAFIINLKKIISCKGNSLGYRVKLKGINNDIPVSRSNSSVFKELYNKYQ